MTYTTEQAIALAREHFADPDGSLVCLTPELTAFANAVRKQTLLEAAEYHETQYGHSWELRRMAGK